MSNVTAEEICHWLATGDGPDEGYPGWTKRLGETARRGLEMRDEIKHLYDPGLDSFAVPTKELERIVKEFESGASPESPLCAHGIPRKECGSDD